MRRLMSWFYQFTPTPGIAGAYPAPAADYMADEVVTEAGKKITAGFRKIKRFLWLALIAIIALAIIKLK